MFDLDFRKHRFRLISQLVSRKRFMIIIGGNKIVFLSFVGFFLLHPKVKRGCDDP